MLDVEPEIRSRALIMAADVLKHYPDLIKKRFFKTMFENALLDGQTEVVFLTLKLLQGMIRDKNLHPFIKKLWKDNTKIMIQLCLE